jgi:hypothetical protein
MGLKWMRSPMRVLGEAGSVEMSLWNGRAMRGETSYLHITRREEAKRGKCGSRLVGRSLERSRQTR